MTTTMNCPLGCRPTRQAAVRPRPPRSISTRTTASQPTSSCSWAARSEQKRPARRRDPCRLYLGTRAAPAWPAATRPCRAKWPSRAVVARQDQTVGIKRVFRRPTPRSIIRSARACQRRAWRKIALYKRKSQLSTNMYGTLFRACFFVYFPVLFRWLLANNTIITSIFTFLLNYRKTKWLQIEHAY